PRHRDHQDPPVAFLRPGRRRGQAGDGRNYRQDQGAGESATHADPRRSPPHRCHRVTPEAPTARNATTGTITMNMVSGTATDESLATRPMPPSTASPAAAATVGPCRSRVATRGPTRPSAPSGGEGAGARG